MGRPDRGNGSGGENPASDLPPDRSSGSSLAQPTTVDEVEQQLVDPFGLLDLDEVAAVQLEVAGTGDPVGGASSCPATPARMSRLPATNMAGTVTLLSRTRACRRCSAPGGCTTAPAPEELLDRDGGELGVRHRVQEPVEGQQVDRARPDRQPRGDRRQLPPPCLRARATLTVMARATGCGSRSGREHGAERVARDAATANSPVTRSGCRTASSNIVLTPIDQPISTARSMPKWSMTERPSSTKCSISTWLRVPGRSEPPMPRWFQETTRTPQSGRQQRRPHERVGAEAVAQHHRRAVDRRRGRWSRRAGGCRRRT